MGGFDVSDTAANVMADLDQLNDPNISAITISDNGQISASVAQLTADATAIGDLRNANPSLLLAINDTAGAVQTGLSTLVAEIGEIGSITIAAPDLPGRRFGGEIPGRSVGARQDRRRVRGFG